MAFKFNPTTGKLDVVGLTPGKADSIYLRLDTTNDPLTGNLEISVASAPTLTFTEGTGSGTITYNGSLFINPQESGSGHTLFEQGSVYIKKGQKLFFDS